jgi:hypothetical protein
MEKIKSRIFTVFGGASDDIIQPLDKNTSTLSLWRRLTRTSSRRREKEGCEHKIIFNQHLPFERLAFH